MAPGTAQEHGAPDDMGVVFTVIDSGPAEVALLQPDEFPARGFCRIARAFAYLADALSILEEDPWAVLAAHGPGTVMAQTVNRGRTAPVAPHLRCVVHNLFLSHHACLLEVCWKRKRSRSDCCR